MIEIPGVYIHPMALVESEDIGEGTKVWAFAHVMKGSKVGKECNISGYAMIETGCILGNGVTIKPYVGVGNGVHLDDGVFAGPGAFIANDKLPRSRRLHDIEEIHARYLSEENWLAKTYVGRGVTLGAGCLVAPGLNIGAFAVISLGAVVTKDVVPHRIMAGFPARGIGWACMCGHALEDSGSAWVCPNCPRRYTLEGETLTLNPA
jgi:acetyltransferase-like isoleucine patch superfamily enzyme